MENNDAPLIVSNGHSLFLIGKNRAGQWVVQDENGLNGGLFVDRVQALKYAMFQNGIRPHAVIMVPGVLELRLNSQLCSARASERRGLAQAA